MTEAQMTLELTHPDYENQVDKYELWQDLYDGGDAIEKKSQSALVSVDATNTKRVNNYLPQHAYESDAQYEIRKLRATYRNFAKPVTGVFLSAIWRKPPKRELPDSLNKFVENVDLQGSSADEFFKEHDKNAGVKGVRFVLVDSTKVPEDVEVKTEADTKAIGIRPYFIYVDALNLIDWGFERNEATGSIELAYIVIRESVDEAPGPFEQHRRLTRYKVWTRSTWEVWENVESATGQNEKTIAPKIMEEGTHELGKVPIVPIYYNRKKEMVGLSCFAEVDSLMKRIYCRDSELDKSLFDAAVPLLVTVGMTQDDMEDFVRASSSGLNIPEIGGSASYVEPSGNAFGSTRQAILDDEKSIKEIVLRTIRPDSKVAESAESRRLDKQQLDSQLAGFSQNCEDAEKKCWELALKWIGGTGDIEVDYNDDFDVNGMTSDIIKVFMDMRAAGDISRGTLWEALDQGEMLPPGFDPDVEAEQIDEDRIREQRNNPNLTGLAGKFLTQ